MPKIVEAEARISAKDAGVSKVLDAIAGKFKKLASDADAVTRKAGAMGWGTKFSKELDKLSLAPRQIDAVRVAWEKYALTQRGVKASVALDNLDRWRTRTLANLHAVEAEQQRYVQRAASRGHLGRSVYMLGTGYVAQRVGRTVAHDTAESEQQKARDYLSGLSNSDSARLRQAAQDLSAKYQNVTITDMHEQLREATTSMRSVDKAIEIGDSIGAALATLKGMKDGARAPSELRRFLAGLDVLGKNQNPAEVRELLDGYLRAVQTEGADMDFGGLLQVARQSRSAGGGMSNRFLFSAIPALGRDMGDPQVGTALATGLSQAIAGRGTKQSKEAQEEYGVRVGGVFQDAKLFQTDLDLWTWQKLMPRLAAKGVDLNDSTSVSAAVSSMFSARTIADVVTKLITQKDQYEAKYEQYGRNPGLSAATELPKRDPFVAWGAAAAQLNNALAAIGEPQAERAISVLNGLAAGLNAVSKATREHPDETRRIGAGAGAVAVGALGSAATAAGAAEAGLFSMFLRTVGRVLGPFGPALGIATAEDLLKTAPDGRPWPEVLRERQWSEKGKAGFSIDDVRRSLYGSSGSASGDGTSRAEIETTVKVEPSDMFIATVKQRVLTDLNSVIRDRAGPPIGTTGSVGGDMPGAGAAP